MYNEKAAAILAYAQNLSKEDYEQVHCGIVDQLSQGWSEIDIIRYWNATCYLNPELDEDIGIKRMAAIQAKYGAKK